MAGALSSSSQKLMQEISDQFLICKICFETFSKPKTLTCLHIFCTVCLEKHMDAEVERSYRYMLYTRSITCPVCRKKTDLPSGGVRRLPDNFLIANLIEIVSRRRGSGKVPQCEICKPMGYQNSKDAVAKCLECGKIMCSNCVELHRRTKVTRSHSLIDTQVEKSIGCKVHQEEVVRFYCEPCEMCICVLCTFQEHKGHNIQSFSEGMQKYQNSLDTLVSSCRERITCVKQHLDMIKACEEEIRKAEDQIRDTTIESISALRASEKQQVEELYDVFGDDTIQFLKEKHVLQDILDNLMSSCSLTEIILKDKSIELLLLRREIQDKLEVLLQGRVQPPPVNLLKQVTFNPGQITPGRILIDGEPIGDNGNAVVLYDRSRGCDEGVQTSWEDWAEDSCNLQTDDDKLGRQPHLDRRDRSVNTCSPDRQTTTTMTDSISSLAETVDSWNQYTNTPTVQLVDRSTLTTRTSMSDSQTETKGLIDYRSTIAGPELPSVHSMGMTTDLPDVRSKATSTMPTQQADKKTSTYKTITHDIACDPVKISTHDFGVMIKPHQGVEKGIGTKTIVQSEMGVGTGSVSCLQTTDVGTDTIWKGIRRVRHKATMHELLYNTQETETDNLVITEERASSPHTPIEESVISSKRKYTTVVPNVGSKRTCTLETTQTQTDLNLQTLSQIWKRSGHIPKPEITETQNNMNKQRDVVNKDRGTTMGSCVRVTDIGTGTVQVRIIDHGVNTKTATLRNSHTNTPKLRLVDSETGTATQMCEDKGVATVTLRTVNKETATVSTKVKERGTETYVQSVEKATYMIQPVILSTGTNTPMVLTSDKKSETDFARRDSWDDNMSQSVGVNVNATAAINMTQDSKRTAITDRDFCRPFTTSSMDPDMAGQTRLTGERGMTGVRVQGAETSTLAVETSNKETTYDQIKTSNRATMTFILMSDIVVNKRPLELTRSTSMKKIKTVDMDIDVPHQIGGDAESTAATDGAILASATDRPTSNKPEKNTATFKVELKNTGVGTPIVKFHDRDSSPIRIGTFERSTSMSGIELSSNWKKAHDPVATIHGRGCSPPKSPHHQRVMSVSKAPSTVKVKMVERGSSPSPLNTIDCGTGMAHIVYYEKGTCTPKINMMNKNVETENIRTADKQTATSSVTNAYKDLITPKGSSVIRVSRGTCTTPARLIDRETSPIKDHPFQVETGTNPIRKIYITKGVGVTKADLMCPVDTFPRAGQSRPRILPKNMPVEEPDPKFDPMATIQESDEDDEGSRSGNSSPGCGLKGRMRLNDDRFNTDINANTHREKLWVTAPRLGNGNGGYSSVGVSTGEGCSSGVCGVRAGWIPSSCNQGGQSTFSANGSTQTSSILCKVETGTSTPPVEMEDKAMCTESISVDGKITECISKLRAVSQRLEAQTTSLVIAEASNSAGPIYSKADSFRRESLTTQATLSPVLIGRVASGLSEGGSEHCEGLAPLLNISKRPLRKTGSRLGEMPERACPPFLAKRELHSIDTGMVDEGPAAGGGEAPSSMNGADIGATSNRSKARKQRLDITQLLHRPLGSTTMAGGVMPHLAQRVPYRPSLGLKLSSLDECSRQQQSNAAIKRLQAKMKEMESPEEEHAPSSPLCRNMDLVDTDSSSLSKQRTEKPKLERMLGSLSSSSSTTSSSSPTSSPKSARQHTPKVQQKPSPTVVRKSTKSSKSRSPPVKREKVPERRESTSSENKGVCCGLAGSSTPCSIRGGTQSPRSAKKGLKEIGRLRKVSSGSPCSSSSTSEDGRDSPGDRINRRNRKEP